MDVEDWRNRGAGGTVQKNEHDQTYLSAKIEAIEAVTRGTLMEKCRSSLSLREEPKRQNDLFKRSVSLGSEGGQQVTVWCGACVESKRGLAVFMSLLSCRSLQPHLFAAVVTQGERTK